MLTDGDCLNDGLAELKAEDFSDRFHQHVFEAMNVMWQKEQPVNAITVYEEIKSIAKGRGTSWMALKDAFWPKGTFAEMVRRLADFSKARKLAAAAQAAIQACRENEPVESVIESLESELFNLTGGEDKEDVVTPKQQAEDILSVVAERMDEKSRNKKCLYTASFELNTATGGLEAGDLVIISGPPGGGKTALTQNIVKDIAITQKVSALYINTEMSKGQMALRWAAILSSDDAVNNTSLRAGRITDEQFGKLTGDLDAMYNGGLHTVTIPELTIPKMMAAIRRYSMQHGIRLVAVDYIGRVDTMNSNKDDWKQLLSAAKKLKTIGQKYGLVVLMVAQNDKSGNLAMASYMEHEADLHLHVRPFADEKEQAKYGDPWNYVVQIKKGRSAPKGLIPVRYVGNKLTFVYDKEVAKHYEVLDAAEQIQRKAAVAEQTASKGNFTGDQRRERNAAMPW